MAKKIKVCGLCSLEQIAALSAMGVDYCGIIFHEPSVRYAPPRLRAADVKALQLQTRLTGVFVDKPLEFVVKMIEEYGLKAVQLCGNENPEYCKQLRGVEVIKVFHVGDTAPHDSLGDFDSVCDFFLFDTKSSLPGGSGKKFDWHVLKGMPVPKPFFLSGGIGPEDVERLVALDHPFFYGVDINSAFELSPGVKNIPAIEKFYNQINCL